MNTMQFRGRLAAAVAALAWLLAGRHAGAQVLPAGPVVFGEGRVVVSGDVTVTFGCAHAAPSQGGWCADDVGFFNYTDYERSLMRMVRVDLATEVRATGRVSLLAEVRTESDLPTDDFPNTVTVRPYALFVRVKPWTTRAFDIQIGRVPPTFGAFSRQTYAADNSLIGYPLAYQYLTSIRPDSLPANADELASMRGRGWLAGYSIGQTQPAAGRPLLNAMHWDTGVQLHTATGPVEVTASLTSGTLANPLVGDDNNGRQAAARVALKPAAGLRIGVSGAHGPFVTREASTSAGRNGMTSRYTQTAWGADVEYARGYYVLRFETVLSDWRVPLVREPRIELPLRAVATALEGRYKVLPGLYAAARVEHLGFSRIATSRGRTEWDAPTSRVEIGGGYALQRNVLLKASVQHNRRDGGRTRRLTFTTAQLVYWF